MDGAYEVQLIVSDGHLDSEPDTVAITAGGVPNTAPRAEAGDDESVPHGASVRLDGSGSSDLDGDALTYAWSLVSMPTDSAAALEDADATRPGLIADRPGAYVAQLVVNDGTTDSQPDTVTITAVNAAPVAHAGPDQTSPRGTTVPLDGSLSGDADGGVLTYHWTLQEVPAGSAAALDDAASATPTFVADVAGIYVARLVVNDGYLDSEPDTVTATAEQRGANTPPVADAGPDGAVSVMATANLDGTGSHDADGDPLSYEWTLLARPLGSAAHLGGATSVAPTLLADVAGEFVVQLIVNDGHVDSAPATVTVAGLDGAPPEVMVDPLEYGVEVGQALDIDVTATDPDGDVVTLAASPALDNATFAAAAGVDAAGTFSLTPGASQEGAHVVSFTARDPQGLSDTKHVQITVSPVNRPPTLSVPAEVEVDEGKLLNIALDADDPDGDVLTLTAGPLPDNAIFLPATATLTFAPDYDQAGAHAITCEAGDGELSSGPQVVNVTVNDVTEGGPAQELVLVVDPVESPSLLTEVLITGVVNPSGELPPPQRITSALIVGMAPATGEQGQTLDVTLTGQAGKSFPTHFVHGVSQADFGPGTTVNAVTVNGPSEAVVNVTIGAGAAPGPRPVRVTTGNEVAVSVLSFNVTAGRAHLTGVVVDPDTGRPLQGVIVSIRGTNVSTVTDRDGRYLLRDVPAGTQTLLFNAPDHEFLAREVNVGVGGTTDLGEEQPRTTVFDPSAPPSATTLSVVGRGVTDPVGGLDLEAAKQAVEDAMLLVGGSEAGVLDEYGNQLNANVEGDGLLSVKSTGVDIVADRMHRGESIALQDMLYALSFAAEWSDGPPDLEEWLALLQESVDEAWRDPTAPENSLLVLLFNKGVHVLPNPPTLTPYTRLNAFQGYLLGASILSASVLEAEGGGPKQGFALAAPAQRAPARRSVLKTAKQTSAPVADAGPDQAIAPGTTVLLDGSGSYHPEGFGLTYAWTLSRPAGSTAALSNAAAEQPTFVADVEGEFVARLVVSDGVRTSLPDTVFVDAGGAPQAGAGPDQHVLPEDVVQFDGSGSYDPEGDALTYQWALVTAPYDSAAALADDTTVNPTLETDLEGRYVVQLVVNDGEQDSRPDTIIVTANTEPVAYAGRNRTVSPGDTVQLNGGDSYDPDGDSLNYAWSIVAKPFQSSAAVDSPTFAAPTFVADLPGEYDVQLIVNDGWEDSEPHVITITAGGPPVAHAGVGGTVEPGETIQLSGRNSWDPDGDPLTYLWTIVSGPHGSAALLSDPTAVNPTLTPDKDGDYVLRLLVNDGVHDSPPNEVTYTVGGARDYFTGYWRNFFERKQSVLEQSWAEAYVGEMDTVGAVALLMMTGDLIGAMVAANVAGTAPDSIGTSMLNAAVRSQVPDPPRNVRAEARVQPDGTQQVVLTFERSPDDPAYPLSQSNLFYTYRGFRFRGTDERRELVETALFDHDAEALVFHDAAPLNGTNFYAVNVTRAEERGVVAESWWPGAFRGALNIFAKGRRRLVSDYSAPASVYVGPGDVTVTFDGLEVHPDWEKGLVYYSDAGNGVLYGIDDWGRGERVLFANAGFKPSFRDGREIEQYGLAVDSQGNLYCDNAASDAAFGGRLFRFEQTDGNRLFCGTIRYFSQVLMFAHPCQAGSMVIRPAHALRDQTLVLVDTMKQEILEVPVNHEYEANRRVGQPFGELPPGGWGTVLDMEFDTHDYLYVLDGWRVLKVKDRVAELGAYFTP